MPIYVNGKCHWIVLILTDFKGLFGWMGEKVGEQKIMREWKSQRTEKILISFIFVQLEVEKWRDKKSEFV